MIEDQPARTAGPDPSDSRGRVLVAGGSTDTRAHLVRVLAERWQVETVDDGPSALARVQEGAPDAVVADVMLDGLDGISLVRRLRETPAGRLVPVILLSARAGSEWAVQGLTAGADDYLVTPFIDAELVARVNAQLQLGRARRQLSSRAALLAAQIESAPQAILAVSPDRKVLACNRRFEELWHLPPGSVSTGAESPALQEPSLSQVADPAAFEEALRWGHRHPDQMQRLDVPLVDGRVVEGISAPIIDEAGAYHGRIWFLNDDTERRQAETDRTALVERLQAAQRSQSFLLSAAHALARTSGYAESLRELAAVAVPTLGDVCLIDVIDESGALRRLAARHADPAHQALVDELGRRYPPDPSGLHPSVDVVRSRRSRWSDSMPDAFLRATTRDERHYQLTKLLHFTSYMTVPLISGADVLGTITLVSAGSGRRFGTEDLELAEALASQVAAVAGKARRHEQDQQAAHALQASLLPSTLPSFPGLTIAVRYLPATSGAEVGGDWYDVVKLPTGAAALTVGDVAGHDIGAAGAMGALRYAARALIGHSDAPAGLIQLLHGSWEHLGVDRMATCVVARVDARTGNFSLASAGHPPPLMLAASGASYLPIDPSGPLGSPGTAVSEYSCRLDPGSVLLFYTDGLVEDRRAGLEDGLSRLLDVAAGGPADPEGLCDHVLGALARERADDIALLAVRLGAPGESGR